MKPAAPLILLLVSSAVSGQDPRDRENPGYRDPRLTEAGQIAPLLEGLGEHHHPITTSSERAQLFFDQGLRLTYGFNHREAARAFREAARLDPACAMPYWGLALVHGPNLNLPMDEESGRKAYQAIRKAVALKPGVSLAQSLRAQGQTEAAAQMEARFQKAWVSADVELSASRF